MTDLNVALVSGASSGIGREIARCFVERGFRVFGSMRDPESVSSLPKGVEPVVIDVTDDSIVNDTVTRILRVARRIDVVVNNAGYMLTGALEETSLDEARQQFETNFFGVLRVIQAGLPAMRRQRSGRIINISSVLGFLPAPYMGIYAASKHAIEAYTETLDHEIRSFGVRAILVEPDFTQTGLGKHGHGVRAALEAYAPQKRDVIEAIQNKIANGDDPTLVAETVFRAATSSTPRLRYPVGRGVILSRLRRFVPPRMLDRSLRKEFHMSNGRKRDR